MNKKVILAASAVITGALVAAATVTAQGSATKVSLWFHDGQGGERQALNATIKAFNDANKDVQIEAVQLPGGSYSDQVNAAALANGLPCLLDFDGPNLYNYAWSGKLIPIDKYVDAKTKADFLPSIIRQGTYNGKLYSLGQFDSGLAIWGNKKLLAKAGIRIPTSTATAWTGAQFMAALSKLKASGLQYPLDMKFNYGKGEWYSYGFAPIMQSFGGDLIDRKGGYKSAEGTINGEAALKGMTYFRDLVKEYVNVGNKSDTDFAEGKAALSYVGHWTFPDYSKALGSDLVLIPMPKFGNKAVTGSGSWNWGITSDCKTPDQAAKVLNFIVSADEGLAMSNANGAVPARKSAIAKSKNYAKGGPLAIYVDQINRNIALERPVTPAYPAISKAFTDAVANIVTGADVKAEMDKAAKAIDQDIKDNNGYPVK
jgi:multiple sugar transport system substrate-binding protein